MACWTAAGDRGTGWPLSSMDGWSCTVKELPPPPKCDPCPERDQGQTASTGSGSTPVSSVQRLPFTGLDKERTTLVLSGFGLLAIGLGLAVRRRAFRP